MVGSFGSAGALPSSHPLAAPALPRLGLGCARVGSFNNPQSLGQSRALIEAALAMGVTLLDTASIYGQGDSERTIGRALRGKRDAAFVVTKAGQGFSARMRTLRMLKPVVRPLLARRAAGERTVTTHREAAMRTDWRPASLVRSLEGSLQRLGTDHVDGFLLHSPPAAVAVDEAVAAALADLKRAGKLHHFGVSCDDLACLDAALTMPGLELLQLPYGLIVAAADTGRHETIRDRGIRVLAREVIRGQPGIDPVAAVANAMADPIVSCTLIGTTNRANLARLADAMEGHRA